MCHPESKGVVERHNGYFETSVSWVLKSAGFTVGDGGAPWAYGKTVRSALPKRLLPDKVKAARFA